MLPFERDVICDLIVADSNTDNKNTSFEAPLD
jgi:hypothetical protein